MEEKDEHSEVETAVPIGVDSRESLIPSNQNEVIIKVSELDTKPLCRICYQGSSKERLLRPCKCKGTIEYVHRRCLERWLEARNVGACELCLHQFETKRTRKSCWEWLRTPEMQVERRNFIGDCTCFAFLTPLGVATFWLCAEGAIYYQTVKTSTLETVALLTLAVFLVVAYFTWVVMCTRYHLIMFRHWRDHSYNIQIIDHTSSDDSSDSSNTTFITIPSESSDDPTGIAEQPVVRYVPAMKEADPYVNIIGIVPLEMTPQDNSSTSNENKSGN